MDGSLVLSIGRCGDGSGYLGLGLDVNEMQQDQIRRDVSMFAWLLVASYCRVSIVFF